MAYPKEYYVYGQKCPVFYGPGVVKEIGEQVKKYGGKKPLVVTDPFLVTTYIVDSVKKSLEEAGVEYAIYSDVNVDPSDVKIYAAVEMAKAEGCDMVIGVGGGGPMDAAKSIAILLDNEGPLSKYYMDFAPNNDTIIFEVATTSGTGSECTFFSVISDTTTGTKKVPYRTPNLAFCDPELTYSLPQGLTAATGMDAFAHAAETMTGLIQNPHTDALCYFGISELCKYLPRACKDGSDKEAREHLMNASNLIGIGFGEMGCHLGHAIGQCIGAAFHTTHGISCAWALPATMEYSAVANPDKVKLVAEAMGIDTADISDAEIGKVVSDAISALMTEIKLQPMSEYGISRDGLIGIADIVMQDNCWPVIPSPLTKAELEDLLGKVYDSFQG